MTTKKRSTVSWVVRAAFAVMIVSTVIAAGVGMFGYWKFSQDLPKIITPSDYRPLAVTRIVTSPSPGQAPGADNTIGEFYKERRYVIPFEKIPDVVVKAFISAEDDRFFEHQGFNLASILRASIANFRAGHVVQGGSTITQQVAKSLLLTPERSFVRKIKEVILASRIEKNLTKQQILYLYLNQIYLGHGAYGIEAASETYFHKKASDLALPEAAVLAGMPQAPGKYSPTLNPKKAKSRQLYVLKRMHENGYISQKQMEDAGSQPLKVYGDDSPNEKYAPYLVEYVRRYLVDKYGEDAVYKDGLTAVLPTTKELVVAAGKSLREGLRSVDKRGGYRGPVQRLKSGDEMEKFLVDERAELVDRKLGFVVFTPDGRTDPVAAIQLAGLGGDLDLLDEGEIYQAVVTAVDDSRKYARLMIGAAKAELSMEQMNWARPYNKDGPPVGPFPTLPSKVLAKGDVVLVKVLQKKEGVAVVGLEQEPEVQGAVFSMDAQTGAVLAMEGGYDFEKSEFNRATQAQRQPGSSFKPIIYASALEKGYTPASIIVDSPIVYQDGDAGKWKPSNFEEKFYGDTTFRQALIHSRNVPTIKMVQALSVPYVIDYAKRIGLDAQFKPDLSISLGSAATSLMEMTKVYALFPRLGRKISPVFISKVIDRDGKVLEENKLTPYVPSTTIAAAAPAPGASPTPSASGTAAEDAPKVVFPAYPLPNDPDQVLDPRVASVMTHLMREVVSYGTGHEAKTLGRVAAGKTGTTNDYVDAWFMGFTPNVVTGVWVGYDSQKSIGPLETGARAALPIWLSYMREAVKNYPDTDFPTPDGVVYASIDANTGKLAPPNSSRAIKEEFIEGTQPTAAGEAGGDGSDAESKFLKEDIE